MPNFWKIYRVNPEQSKPDVVVPPYLYGVPATRLTAALIGVELAACVVAAPEVNTMAAPKMDTISFFKKNFPLMPTELAKGSVEGISLYSLWNKNNSPAMVPPFSCEKEIRHLLRFCNYSYCT